MFFASFKGNAFRLQLERTHRINYHTFTLSLMHLGMHLGISVMHLGISVYPVCRGGPRRERCFSVARRVTLGDRVLVSLLRVSSASSSPGCAFLCDLVSSCGRLSVRRLALYGSGLRRP